MRLLLLLCAVTDLSYAKVVFSDSTLYDVYDFEEKEVHLDKCDKGCLIYASTMGNKFEDYPDQVDPYASNLFIHDVSTGKDIMRRGNVNITDLAKQVDAKMIKIPLTFEQHANISVINRNSEGAEKFTVALWVVEMDLKICESSLAGFDTANDRDSCEIAFVSRNSTLEVPFPGFTVQPNTPLITLVIANSTSIVLRPTYGFEEHRLLSDGFITSPGWNDCRNRYHGGYQSFRSPFDKQSDTFLMTTDDKRDVAFKVDTNFKGATLMVTPGDENQWFPTTTYDGVVSRKKMFAAGATRLNISYTNAQGSDGFSIQYYSNPVPEQSSWTAPGKDSTFYSYCNCAMKDGEPVDWKTSEIWVELIIIIDTSNVMVQRLEEAKAMVTSFVSGLNTDTNAEFYTRIGVIAASDTAEVIYNLNMASTDKLDSITPSNVAEMDFDLAFQAALNMLESNKRRGNTQAIVYFLTNSVAPASVFSAQYYLDGIIIVNEFISEGGSPLESLKSLASKNYYFTDLSEDFTRNWGVLCEANCFCKDKWNIRPFNDDSKSVRTRANLGCFHSIDTAVPQQLARENCTHIAYKSQGALVSIHDPDKEFFVNSCMAQFGTKTKYWIGLQSDEKEWNWEDESTSSFSDWDANQPDTNGGKNQCAYASQISGFKVKWTAADCELSLPYSCETAPCAVGNKCY